ncbi:MAG: DUF1440 domain-containing protein [Corynebacterium sp.]|nr:DUF1440 domain-containing protein [Corynebacterium sp.]
MFARRPSLRSRITVGIVAGILSGIVKFGWEVPFPPRSPERNETNPPQQMLQNMGVPKEITHSTYTILGNKLPWVSFVIHFAFSIVFSVLYMVLAGIFPSVRAGRGAIFGILVWLFSHVILMPAARIVPGPADQPIEEHLSEFFGHIVWMYPVDLMYRVKFQG